MSTSNDYKKAAIQQAIYMCEARIENGAEVAEALNWLEEETDSIMDGDRYEALDDADAPAETIAA